ncbi:MAG: sugar phosphate isomerase/epimerase [Fimbriimonadaceae bacterium]|nr:sugar phosphate isomerase/epimerase [Fimbriimonadaceae bacterium]
MSSWQLGAHTWFFTQYGWDPAEDLAAMADAVAAAGYEEIELWAPQVAADGARSQIRGALSAAGLRLVGVSHGQPYWDPAQFERILTELTEFCDRLTALDLGPLQCGCSCAGKRLAQRSDAENEQCIRAWTAAAELFRARGHRLVYHTHGEPREDIDLIVEGVPADLLDLGPDLDWLRVGGVDPLPFVRQHAARLTMLHLRDYHLGGDRTEALGEGEADYAALAALLDEVGFTGEAVVELAVPTGAQPTRPAAELLALSRQHLRATMGR